MSVIASQITSLTIVYPSVYSGTDQRQHQSSASLAFVRGIHRWPVNSPHKGQVTWKMFPFDDVIMKQTPSICVYAITNHAQRINNLKIILCYERGICHKRGLCYWYRLACLRVGLTKGQCDLCITWKTTTCMKLGLKCVGINVYQLSWWRHQLETFSVSLAFCAGNSPVTGEFPSQRPVTRSFDVSFDLRLNKRLSKQSWGWWFETPSRSLWRHRNVHVQIEGLNMRSPWFR